MDDRSSEKEEDQDHHHHRSRSKNGPSKGLIDAVLKIVSRSSFLIFLIFSLTRSKMTMVSLIENPIIVRITASRVQRVLDAENGDGTIGYNDVVEKRHNPAQAI